MATDGVDFAPVSGTIMFNPNATSRSFNLMVVSDETPELGKKHVILPVLHWWEAQTVSASD